MTGRGLSKYIKNGAMRTIHYIVILSALSAALFLPGLGKLALTDPDETFYAQTAREMLEEGDWVTPRIFGEPQYEKPPLYYWLVMLSYKVFGVSEFSARFPSIIFAFLGILGVFLTGRLFYSRLTGFLSSVILATGIEYFVVGRACVTDTVLTVFIIYTIFFFMSAWSSGRRSLYLASSAAAALAVLTKGPIGLFIPGAVILIYLIWIKEVKDLFRKVPVLASLCVFFTVALPWYAAVYFSNGSAFVDEFFGVHNVIRFLHPEHRIGDTPFFFVPVVIAGIFPWTVFFLFAVWDMYKRRAKTLCENARKGSAPRSPHVFLAVWFLLVFLFFSVSRTKLVTYILPLFPAVAIITGRFWERMMTGGMERFSSRMVKWMSGLYVLSCFMVAGGVIGFVWYRFPASDMFYGSLIGSALVILCAFLAASLLLRGKILLSFSAITLSFVLAIIPVVIYVFPTIEEYESRKALSLAIKDLAGPDDSVGAECDHRRGVAFYSGRTDVEDIHHYADRRRFFRQEKSLWGIMKDRHYDIVKNDPRAKNVAKILRSGNHVLVTNVPIENIGEKKGE